MHVDVKFHKTHERVHDGIIDIRSIASANNMADSMTKPLSRVTFEAFGSCLAPSPHNSCLRGYRNQEDVTSDSCSHC
jgi:hypothetical protein